MRSRYSAFALGLGGYLVRTLASNHSDRETSGVAPERELSRAREKQRFVGLRILREHTIADEAEVLFIAKVFESGSDRSFAELSHFVREGTAWRYASALLLVPRAQLHGDLNGLTADDIHHAARVGSVGRV